jgi:broad specificity phosphatase PhoE
MTRILLVRHAEPEAVWGGQSSDPGLSEKGHAQAAAAAVALEAYGPLSIVSSPMLRAQQTAAPYATARRAAPAVEERVSEIVAPPGTVDRPAWLQARFPFRDPSARVSWQALEPRLHEWRRALVDYLAGLRQDTVVFTHFIAINVVCGAALGADETIVCLPGHASITELEANGGKLRFVRLGAAMISDDVR